ncbi:MAG: polysaccharide deacetylase family protein [Kiritimatiellae bacterium]|nr:polysaccharide deacetylase family protein [Kiritimatiellia bacterium]
MRFIAAALAIRWTGAVIAWGAPVDVTLNPPGGLLPEQTPQMILVTFDDAVNVDVYNLIQTLTAGRVNPNGEGVQFTFFISTDWTRYPQVNWLYAAGHEIGVHTMTHTTSETTSRADWRAEIAGARRTLSRLAQVPMEDIVGFRAPYLVYSAESFRILAEQGFLYDSSAGDAPGISLSTGPNAMIWPYTLHDGLQQVPWTGQPPDESYPELFESPLWALMNPDDTLAASMDPPGNDAEALALLQYNFTSRYEGNRAPMGVFLHASQWLARAEVLNDFLDWAQTHSNVWIVSTRAAVEYMRAPCGIAGADLFPPFRNPEREPWPVEGIETNQFATGTVYTCGVRPPLWPAPDTVFIERADLEGGSASVDGMDIWSTSFEAEIIVQNNSGQDVTDWQVEFDVPNGTLIYVSGGGSWSFVGGHALVHSNAGTPLPEGGSVTLTVGGPRTGEVEITGLTAALYGNRAMRPVISISRGESGEPKLSWTESAYGYVVESADDTPSGWTEEETVHGHTEWTDPAPVGPGNARFYRVRTSE